MTLLALAVLVAFAFYVMKPAERSRFVRAGVDAVRYASGAVTRRKAQPDPFTEALRTRTPQALIVPSLVMANVAVFIAMLVGSGSPSDPGTLVGWGANYGPRTTNGEWGRMLDSLFVHIGPLHLLATVVALLQAGLLTERLVGRLTFSAVYVMSGFFASVLTLRLHPIDVAAGPSGALFGIYGFLAAAAIWGIRRPSGLTIPLETLKTFAPGAFVFAAYNMLSGALPIEAELAGFATGFVSGIVLTKDVAESKPAPRRVVAGVAATFAVAALIAIPLRGITDFRPEIEWIVRLEDGTAARYHAAVERFRKGVITATELAEVIERNIVPEFKSARTRLTTLGRVPREQQSLVARVDEFLRLRNESWCLRAAALEQGNMATLHQADQVEVTSLERLEAIKPAIRQ